MIYMSGSLLSCCCQCSRVWRMSFKTLWYIHAGSNAESENQSELGLLTPVVFLCGCYIDGLLITVSKPVHLIERLIIVHSLVMVWKPGAAGDDCQTGGPGWLLCSVFFFFFLRAVWPLSIYISSLGSPRLVPELAVLLEACLPVCARRSHWYAQPSPGSWNLPSFSAMFVSPRLSALPGPSVL